FLKMQRHRVVNFRPYSARLQEGAELVALAGSNDKLVVNMEATCRLDRQLDPRVEPCATKQHPIFRCVPSTAVGPPRQVTSLHPQDGCLQRVEPEISADHLVEIFRLGAM